MHASAHNLSPGTQAVDAKMRREVAMQPLFCVPYARSAIKVSKVEKAVPAADAHAFEDMREILELAVTSGEAFGQERKQRRQLTLGVMLAALQAPRMI